MAKYTILQTWHEYGSIAQIVDKDKVKIICESAMKCEKLRMRYKCIKGIIPLNVYYRIEVVNNETGEIREYWNNKENKIKF